jgi:Xaa-Pro aminopeptidase
MPVAEFHDRVARLRAAMTAEGLDALLLYGSGLDQCGHPTYVSHYIVKLPFAALVVLPREGEPALLFQGAARARSAAGDTTWMADVRPCWDLAATCLQVVAERGLAGGTIGLAGVPRLMPFADWRTLAAGLRDARLVDAEGMVDRLRAIKSPREIAQVLRARRLVHDALACVTTLRAPDLTETLLAAEVIREARRRGAQDVRLAMGRFLDGTWIFAPPEDAPLAPGERVCVSLAASWERYWAEASMSVDAGAGGLSPAGTDVNARFTALLATVTPGVTATRIARAADGAVDIHGIGITPEEPPVLSSTSGLAIESGMCLAVRAEFEGRAGSACCGDTLVVA